MIVGKFKRTKYSGVNLVFVMVVISLAFLTAFILAATANAHLGFANQTSHRRRAYNLAYCAVQKTLAHLQADISFGTRGEEVEVRLEGDPPDSMGRLTFAASSTIPKSLNNLQGDSSLPGHGDRLVPAHSVHLVGTGRCGDVVRTVELIATLPPYPYAIASSGPIESTGQLLVGTLDSSSEYTLLSPDELLPAHLASNSLSQDSVVLGPNSTITGDVRSTGGFQFDQSVVVKGQALEFGQPVALPKIELSQYDPRLSEGDYQELPNFLTDYRLNGGARCSGDLTVYGDLNLDNGKLYVDGKLTVRGSVLGQGLVVARDGAEILEGARIDQGQAVLLAGGDVKISGDGAYESFFEGLVYTEGVFEAHNITVVGSFIARGDRARIVLQDVRVFGDSQKTKWEPPADDQKKNSRGMKVVFVDDSTDGPTLQAAVGLTEGEDTTGDDADSKDFAPAQPTGDETLYVEGGDPALEASQSSLRGASSPTAPPEGFDLNRFLSVNERMKVTLWHDL